MLKLLFAVVLVVSVIPGSGASASALRVCFEDGDSYPWILHNRPGLTTSLLKMVEAQTAIQMDMTALPWKRCMHEVATGNMDALFKISYSAERAAELGVYPMIDGRPDESKRLFTDSYSLYRLKGAEVSWDGKVLKADGPIGAQSGFSVVDLLKSLGAQVDDGSRLPDASMRKLLAGRITALALQTNEGDATLLRIPGANDNVEKLSPVLVEKPYFFIFSKQFHEAKRKQAEVIWNAIGVTRESAAYKQLVRNFK